MRFDGLFLILAILFVLLLLSSLLLISTEDNYNYCYYKDGNLGLSARCRGYECEDNKQQVIIVSQYISTKDKTN